MNCPKCKEELFCHCKNCISRNFDKTPWLYKNDQGYEMEYCGRCGYTNSPNFWADLEINQLFEKEGVNSFKELEEKRKSAN